MRITEILGGPEPCFSFEFFPPKTEEGTEALFASVEELYRLKPGYVSVTYGAAGSTREGTVEVTTRIKRDYGIETMAHLSCVGETVEGIETILGPLRRRRDREHPRPARRPAPRRDRLPAARPAGCAARPSWPPSSAPTRRTADFGIGASCHPEIHPEAAFAGGRHRLPAREGRRRRRVPDQPALLRQRRLLRLARRRARRRASTCRSSPASCRSSRAPGCIASARSATRGSPTELDAPARGARRRRGGGAGLRDRLRVAPVRGAARRRRARHPLLRAQPRDLGQGDPRRAARGAALGAGRASAGEGRRDDLLSSTRGPPDRLRGATATRATRRSSSPTGC